jgi:hypothetical protein
LSEVARFSPSRSKVTLRIAAPAAMLMLAGIGVVVTHGYAAASPTVPSIRHISSQPPVVTTSIYPGTTVPTNPAERDSAAVELGVRFSPETAGTITSIKYYKGASNTGTHTATLWSSSGARLSTATFTGETATGWQVATLSKPVNVVPGAVYVASYHTNTGHYAQLQNAFGAGRGLGNSYLRATSGVFAYGPSAFPRDTWHNAAYYVDVIFKPSGATAPVAGAPGQTAPIPTQPPTQQPTPTPTTKAPTPPSSPVSSATPTPTPISSVPASTGQFSKPPTAGVPAGVTLSTYTGPSTITKDGTVIDGKDIPFALEIAAKNVVITRSRIHSNSDEGIHVSGSLTISDSTVRDSQNGIGGDNYTATRVEVTNLADDGFKLGDNVHVNQSWCHDMTPSTQAHADCGQMQAGVTNMSVTNSWFDGGRNSALFIAPDLGPSSNGPVLISNNVLGNGNYTLYCVDGDNGRYIVKNITITNNRFLTGSQYGPVTVNVPVTASNNTWFSTGKPISLN